MKVLVTGAKGFIGQHLCRALEREGDIVFPFDLGNTDQELHSFISECDFIVHLAGINRPLNPSEFYDGNFNFTKKLLDFVTLTKRDCPILFSSSTQAALENDYGKSKRMAEDLLLKEIPNRKVYVYRLYNVYGPGARPSYNSVIATWCDAIANNRPISINEKNPTIDFVYIDDVVASFMDAIHSRRDPSSKEKPLLYVEPHDAISLSSVLSLLRSFKESRKDLVLPLQEGFSKKLYATYLSYLPKEDFAYSLLKHEDSRGSFTEFLHIPSYGQVSINVSHPGITKGNHYHETKNEKFLCVSGAVLIKLRKIGTDEVLSYRTDESNLEVVDIPPGYTHSITTLGEKDSVTIMWANEPFDPSHPDTYKEDV